MNLKHCTKCKKWKFLTEFSKDSGNKDGLYTWCKQCVKELSIKNRDKRNKKAKEWRENNKEYVQKYSKNYEQTHKKERNKQKRKRRKENYEYYKDKDLRRTHNISLKVYKKILDEQNNVCAICKLPESIINTVSGKKLDLAVDHNHKTGKIRGLLCGKCNKALGVFNDDASYLLKVIDYLKIYDGNK